MKTSCGNNLSSPSGSPILPVPLQVGHSTLLDPVPHFFGNLPALHSPSAIPLSPKTSTDFALQSTWLPFLPLSNL